MGSPWFYMEFLVAWLELLTDGGFSNPAIFAVEYTLVPEATYPVQAQQVMAGYEAALAYAGNDPRKVCVGGDSAGANLVLSLLLKLGNEPGRPKPSLAVLISPWVTLVSPRHQNTASDYLEVGRLHQFGLQYAAHENWYHPMLSPGRCRDVEWWARASPQKGIFVTYGSEEILAPELEDLVGTWERAGVKVVSRKEPRGIHAWAVASLFLASNKERRLGGLAAITSHIRLQFSDATKQETTGNGS
jgi:acetyl esterase/lipase